MNRRILTCCLAALLGLALSAQTYDDGLPRSTPEAEGIPSEVIADFYRALDRDRDARNVIRPAGGDWQPINPNAGEPIPPQFPPEYKSHPIEINVNIENAVTQDNEGMQILANAVADKITPAIENALESDDNAY